MTDQKKPGRKLIAASPDLDESEREAIKAVKAYETAEKNLALFEAEHAKIFEGWHDLLDKLEQKRTVADAAIRSTDASFGPWERFSEQRAYDLEALCTMVGKKEFIALGGKVTEVPKYEFAKDALEVAIAAGKIAKKVVEAIRTVTPKYRAPKERRAA